jgi:hypothetical protein
MLSSHGCKRRAEAYYPRERPNHLLFFFLGLNLFSLLLTLPCGSHMVLERYEKCSKCKMFLCFLSSLLWLSGECGHVQDLGLDLEAVDGAGLLADFGSGPFGLIYLVKTFSTSSNMAHLRSQFYILFKSLFLTKVIHAHILKVKCSTRFIMKNTRLLCQSCFLLSPFLRQAL